jgi:hypothetical protein
MLIQDAERVHSENDAVKSGGWECRDARTPILLANSLT